MNIYNESLCKLMLNFGQVKGLKTVCSELKKYRNRYTNDETLIFNMYYNPDNNKVYYLYEKIMRTERFGVPHDELVLYKTNMPDGHYAGGYYHIPLNDSDVTMKDLYIEIIRKGLLK